ncbi:hypothetical protein QBC40DRAFT_21214 [Triangularia verruculosa]|uniref:Protein kinase domain-containing protein n=1 Tax=Triangularia verruculosa TaxID=2587418 RepID=A0AAN6XNE4_9PEZI|nr:hypothetical protein QBC40DRAFT_21214 [Triangularia verruculosa]
MTDRMDPITAFKNIVPSLRVQGIDGFGDAEYVPYFQLQDYWSMDRIRTVLEACNAGQSWINSLQKRFLRIFSILVFCTTPDTCMVGLLSHFFVNEVDDSSLPLDADQESTVKIFVDGTGRSANWNTFDSCQHQFNPAQTGGIRVANDRILAPRSILPWKPGPVLSNGEHIISQKYLVNLDAESYLDAPKISVTRFRLENSDAMTSYTDQSTTWAAWRSTCTSTERVFRGILNYRGSFRQNGWGCILFEFANGGSLEKYYTRHDSEDSLSSLDIHSLWKGASELLHGLAYLEKRRDHQDGFKPRDVFVFSWGPPGDKHRNFARPTSRYLFKFRYKHPGWLKPKEPPHEAKRALEFQAPEFSLWEMKDLEREHAGYTYNSFPMVPSPDHRKANIWSLGGIYLEILVWSITGEVGRLQFQSMRERLGHAGAFHNTTSTISLDSMLRRVLPPRVDDVSKAVMDLILGSMLCFDPTKREDASSLLDKFTDILEKPRSAKRVFGMTIGPKDSFGAIYGRHRQWLSESGQQGPAEPHPRAYNKRPSVPQNHSSGTGQRTISRPKAAAESRHSATKTTNPPLRNNRADTPQPHPDMGKLTRRASPRLDETRQRTRDEAPLRDTKQSTIPESRTTALQNGTHPPIPQTSSTDHNAPRRSSHQPYVDQRSPNNESPPSHLASPPFSPPATTYYQQQPLYVVLQPPPVHIHHGYPRFTDFMTDHRTNQQAQPPPPISQQPRPVVWAVFDRLSLGSSNILG